MDVKHLIFTLDNVSLKTFGDSDSINILGEGQEIQHLVEQVLKRAKRVETTKEDENGEVFAASNVKLVAAAHSLKRKGIAQVGAQCSQFLQLRGYGLKDRKLKYGKGNCPPGWPSPLDWSSFRGPGKHSLDLCAEIIMGLKAHQNKEAGVEEDSGDNIEEESEEQDGGGRQVIPEYEIEDEAHLDEDGLDVREESEGGDELPDIPEMDRRKSLFKENQ